jgi:signal transduction histidine kinase
MAHHAANKMRIMANIYRCMWVAGRSAFALWCICFAWQAQATTWEISQAQMSVTAGGLTRHQPVRLPYHWDRLHNGQAGEAVFEMPFELPDEEIRRWGLYLPRVGNAYEVWLNDTLLQHHGDMQNGNGPDYAKSPRYMGIAPELLRKHNIFKVKIRADLGRRAGLTPLILGAENEVYSQYLKNYLRAAIAELCWAVSVSSYLIEEPPMRWPWWGMVATFATAAWGCSMSLFCVEVANWGNQRAVSWLRYWLVVLLVSCPIAGVAALVYGYAAVLTVWFVVFGATFSIFVFVFLRKAQGRVGLPHKLVALAVFLNTLVGLSDVYVVRFSMNYADNTHLRYSSVLFGVALFTIVIMRFRTASSAVKDLLSNMATRVADKEQELALSYQRLEVLARDQERAAERSRILRDMHDGVGSHISAAIRQLESGRASSEEVLHTLRDSLDQLKLSIDTMHLPAGDITALLANLRYRLEPRFKALDIELQWAVDLLAPRLGLGDKPMRHLQFMVFEALSNVLQHASATLLRIELRAAPEGTVHLRVSDNGRGFDPEHVKMAGLRSLRERAAIIGAELLISSVPGHTVIEIVLP